MCFSVTVPYLFIQREPQAAVFIQDEEASLPFLTFRDTKN